MSEERYFAYCPDEGVEFFATADEARSRAAVLIDQWRNLARADGEWCEEVERVCWGKVLGQPIITQEDEHGVDYGLPNMDGPLPGGAHRNLFAGANEIQQISEELDLP